MSQEIRVTDVLDVDRATALVRSSSHKEWDWLTGNDYASAHDLETCKPSTEYEQSFVWLEVDHHPAGLARVSFLPWDTGVLGLPSARAQLWGLPDVASCHIESWLVRVREVAWAMGARLLDLKTDTRALGAASALHRAGYYLADCLLSYGLSLDKTAETPEHRVRLATEADRSAVVELAADVFSDPAQSQNRFVSDPHLGRRHAAALYGAWAANALDGKAADVVFVSDDQGEIAGFLTCRKLRGPWEPGARLADIPLNAVRPRYQGRGHYRGLVNAGVAWALSHSSTRMHIRTQITAAAVHRTWARLGARIVKTLYSFHAFQEAAR